MDTQYEPIRKDAEPYYNLLKEAQIFFEDYNKASDHIHKIWNNINLWWFNEKTINAKQIFSLNYSKYVKKYDREFIKITKSK